MTAHNDEGLTKFEPSLVSAIAAPSQSIRIMGLRVTRALLKTSASNTILEALLERNIAFFLTGYAQRLLGGIIL